MAETSTALHAKQLKEAREAAQAGKPAKLSKMISSGSLTAMYGGDHIAELCAKYDKNGDGIFHVDEVRAIVGDLKEEQAMHEQTMVSRRNYRRLAVALTAKLIIIVIAALGLTFGTSLAASAAIKDTYVSHGANETRHDAAMVAGDGSLITVGTVRTPVPLMVAPVMAPEQLRQVDMITVSYADKATLGVTKKTEVISIASRIVTNATVVEFKSNVPGRSIFVNNGEAYLEEKLDDGTSYKHFLCTFDASCSSLLVEAEEEEALVEAANTALVDAGFAVERRRMLGGGDGCPVPGYLADLFAHAGCDFAGTVCGEDKNAAGESIVNCRTDPVKMKQIGDIDGTGYLWTGFNHPLDMIGQELAKMMGYAWQMGMPQMGIMGPMKDLATEYGGGFGGAIVWFSREIVAKQFGEDIVQCVDPANNALFGMYPNPPPPSPPLPPSLPNTCSGDDDIKGCCVERMYEATNIMEMYETKYMECCERPSFYGCPNFCSDSDVSACCADGPYDYNECCKNPKGWACGNDLDAIKICGMKCKEVVEVGMPCVITWSMAYAMCKQEPPEGFTMDSNLYDVCPNECGPDPADSAGDGVDVGSGAGD